MSDTVEVEELVPRRGSSSVICRDANSFSAAAAFFTAVWVTCVNRVDPMSFFFFLGGGGGGVWEGLRV